MIYRFTIISDEVDDFLREIQIDSEATFYDLHKAILDAVKFPDDQMTSFFMCDEGWEKETEVTLEDMGSRSDEDNWVMRSTKLSDLIEDEGQHMLYVFDPLAERVFFIKLREIITGKELKEAVCTRTKGNPPKQLVDFDAMMTQTTGNDTNMDEDFYGEGFDEQELNEEGLDFNDGEEGPAVTPSIDDL